MVETLRIHKRYSDYKTLKNITYYEISASDTEVIYIDADESKNSKENRKKDGHWSP
jgi:hypothetical protein